MDQSTSRVNQPVYIAVVALVLGLTFDYLFYMKIPGISFLLYVLLTLAGLWLLAAAGSRRLPKAALILCLPLIFFATMLGVRSSPFLGFFNVVASLVLLLMIVKAMIGQSPGRYRFIDYLKLIGLPFSFLVPAVDTLLNLIPAARKPSHSRAIIKGAIITIPILLIFIALFASADLVFAKYVTQIFSFNISLSPEFVLRLVMVAAIAFGFTGAYAYIFRRLIDAPSTVTTSPRYRLGSIETSILLGSVGILFLIFILVQLAYLFGGQSNIASLGITYAEYARKGFFELVTVAIITFILIWSVQKSLSNADTQHTSTFKLLTSLLVVEVLVIMLSAFMRLLLYEQAYGFTELRFYSHTFIVWLGLVYLFLLYKIVTNGTEESLTFKSAISAAAILVFLNLFNPDGFAARQNIRHFAASGKLDTYHLSTLSDDALPETIKVLDLPDQNLRQSFARNLYLKQLEYQNSPLYNQWPSTNLSRQRARQILQSRSAELERSKDYTAPQNINP